MITEKKFKLEEFIEIPKGIEVSVVNGDVKIKGAKGEVTRKFLNPKIKIEVRDNKIIIKSLRNTKREKKIIGTFKTHIKNMIKGCNKEYTYTLKVCSGHFPMNVSLTNDELVIKNFFGEKVPRKLKIRKGVKVKVEGDLIIIEGIDKEECGQIASDIEKLTKRTAYDRRIFQDGCHIIMKGGKPIK